jgi:predicted metal-dependent phosphoesterase TrpH
VRIDFHTHSKASDGALTPAELLQRAVARDIELFALTDHDTVAGYREALAICQVEPGMPQLISGVEYSCRWSGTTIHIVGLGMDCDHPAMAEGLARLSTARGERGVKIAERLAKCGFEGALEGAREQAGSSQLGRPHFAAWMIEQGHVKDFNTAFDKYLGQGKTGDVKAFWPELAEVVNWIVAADGTAIIAHPLKYKFTRMKLRRLVIDFIAAGGGALEIQNGRQTADQTSQLSRLALEFKLAVSIGSDFHREGSYSPDVGVELPRLEGLEGVWERFLSPQAGACSKGKG